MPRSKAYPRHTFRPRRLATVAGRWILPACALGLTAGQPIPAPAAPPANPTYLIESPLRAEDLKPGYVMKITAPSTGRWHDLSIWRWDGAWDTHEPGPSVDQNGAGWQVPVYAGVDGEVIACWRSAPYAWAHADVEDKQQISANYVVIRTADDHYVNYAHMDTNSIPSSVCPNSSASGWMDPSTLTSCQAGSKCFPVDAYIAGSRPQVVAGQQIGRIGAHGQAAGVHLHVEVGDVSENTNGVLGVVGTAYNVAFTRTWFQPRVGGTDVTPWFGAADAAGQQDFLETIHDDGGVFVWPSSQHPKAASAPPTMSDYDGDGEDDLLCHNAALGEIYLDFAWSGQLNGTNWPAQGQSAHQWCWSPTQRLHTGDFNGDGRDDLLCHDVESGALFVDYADTSGLFGSTEFSHDHDWCLGDTEQLHVGDFDADGIDDLLCHDFIDGRIDVDYADDTGLLFAGSDDSNAGNANGWCYAHHQRLHVGKILGTMDHLVCHDTLSGDVYVNFLHGGDYGVTNGGVSGPYCKGPGQQLMFGDVQGDSREELVCFDGNEGETWVDAWPFGFSDWNNVGTGSSFCNLANERIRLGDVDGDGHDDLVCVDQVSGRRSVDFVDDPGVNSDLFSGMDWESAPGNNWCWLRNQGLY